MTSPATRPDSGRAAAPRRWLAGRTLRGRLIAGLVVLLALACAAVGLATFLSLHGFLMGQLDQQLAAASQRYTQCVNRPPPEPDNSDNGGRAAPQSNPVTCGEQQGGATFSATVAKGKITSPILAGSDHCPLTTTDH